MAKNMQGLSEALKEFQEKLQSNEDAIANLIEQREQIRKAPANKADVFSRMENIITSMSARYLDAHKGDFQKLTSYTEPDVINLFTKTKRVDGATLTLFDPDALAFFNQESLLVAVGAISKEITLSNAGLPFDEREKKIAAINNELSKLGDEKQSLYKQASDAGLVVTEEYAAL